VASDSDEVVDQFSNSDEETPDSRFAGSDVDDASIEQRFYLTMKMTRILHHDEGTA